MVGGNAGRVFGPPRVARLLVPAALAAVTVGAWAGLGRLGWDFPGARGAAGLGHGALMVNGFVGTLIATERSVALRARVGFAGPVLGVATAVALVLGPSEAAPALATLEAVAVVGVFAAFLRRHAALPLLLMALAALLWVVGNLRWWTGAGIADVVPWWAAFLVLTVAGERLELAPLSPFAPLLRRLLPAGALIVALALALHQLAGRPGAILLAAAFIAIAASLAVGDVARRGWRRPGQPRFVAFGLVAAYAWLGVGGLLLLDPAAFRVGPPYDATVHAIFLGFVISAIFAHAPVILPAVLGLAVPYHSGLFIAAVALHVTLATRVAADLGAWADLRRWAGLGNAVALLGFFALLAGGVIRARLASSSRGAAGPG